MRSSPFCVLCLVLWSTLYAGAQTDSLYAQQWNRDPVLSLQHTASTQRQIITAKQIQATGYTRLSDLLQLLDGWTYTTFAGDKWMMQSNGTGSYSNQNWILMLNGQRVEMNRDEAIDVNKLGFSIADIERIEVVNSTGMYLGEFVQNGLVHITTKKSPEGLSSRTYYGQLYNPVAVKSASGRANPELGYSIYQTLGYTHKKFHIHLSAGGIDNPIGNSISGYSSPHANSGSSAHLEAQYSGNKITHQVQVGLSGLSERNLETNFIRAGYLGVLNISSRQQFRLSSAFNRGSDFSQSTTVVTNTLQHRYCKPSKNGNFIWQNGVGLDFLNTQSERPLFSNGQPGTTVESSAWVVKPYSSVNIPVTRKTNVFSDLQLAVANEKVAPKFSIGLYKRVSFISNYSFVFSYNEQLLEEYFLNTINRRIGVMDGAPYFYNPKQSTADFYYNINFGNSVKFSFNSGLKNTFDLPEYRSVINPMAIQNNVSTYIKRAIHQFNWINRVNVHYDIIKNLVLDVNYMHTRIISTWDDQLFNVPKHKFTLTLQYDLPKRYSLWTRHYWQSETHWSTNAFGSSYYGSNSYQFLPAIYTSDLGISKKLFKEYLNLNISARNLFNSNERYHPIAQQFDLRYSASITANIDGLFASRAAKP
jgi:hypothetical protein